VKFLIAYSSARGTVAGLATSIAEELRYQNHHVVLLPARTVTDITEYSAVIVGGGVYGDHWHHDAVAFVNHFAAELRKRPTWLFSVRSLHEDLAHELHAPIVDLTRAAATIDAVGIRSFDSRLHSTVSLDETGISRLRRVGDWRDEVAVQEWVGEIERDRRIALLTSLGLEGFVPTS